MSGKYISKADVDKWGRSPISGRRKNSEVRIFPPSRNRATTPFFFATMPRMQAQDRETPFQALFESSPDAIFIEDTVGNVLNCNPAAATLHGMPREQIVGKNVAKLVPPEHRSRLVTLQTEGPNEFEGFSLTADGRSIPVSIRTSRIQYF